MPTLSRISLRSRSSLEYFQLSSRRRAALRSTLRKSESAPAAAHSQPGLVPLNLQIWLPLLLLPLIVLFLAMVSVARAAGSGLRWVVIWSSGFFLGGFAAWSANAIFSAGYAVQVVWAAGGFLGLVLMSAFYGMCLEWLFWLARHESNPYAGAVTLSAEQQTERLAFAKRLHWPTALSSAAGGCVFALGLFPIIAGTVSNWPAVWVWGLLGGIALAGQGFCLGLFLGRKRLRVVFDASRSSLGEYVGWHVAHSKTGWRGAFGWALGYAIHQMPAGLIAGLALGVLTRFLAS